MGVSPTPSYRPNAPLVWSEPHACEGHFATSLAAPAGGYQMAISVRVGKAALARQMPFTACAINCKARGGWKSAGSRSTLPLGVRFLESSVERFSAAAILELALRRSRKPRNNREQAPFDRKRNECFVAQPPAVSLKVEFAKVQPIRGRGHTARWRCVGARQRGVSILCRAAGGTAIADGSA